MHIAEHQNLCSLGQLKDRLFQRIYFWMQTLTWCLPFPIQITPRQVTPVVPMYHPIRIHHGHNLENKVISQLKSILIVARQIIYHPFRYIRRHRLAGMHPPRDKYNLLRLRIREIGYGQYLHPIPRQRPGQCRSVHNRLADDL